MPFTTSRVDTEAELRQCQEIIAACLDADFVALPADPIDDILPVLSTGTLNGDPAEYWIGRADGEVVSTTLLRYSEHDNLDMTTIQVHVDLRHRRRGYGRAAAEAAMERARSIGRPKVLAQAPSRTRTVDPSPAERLAKRLGATMKLTECRRVLDLKDVTPARVAQLDATVGSAAEGYALLSWSDHTPPEHVEDMARLLVLMSTDPPQGELDLEPEVWDAKRYLDWEAATIARGRTRLVVAAQETATGRLAGFTDIAIPASARRVGYQWATIVSSEHRGHRLGMALKLANLRHLIDAAPEVEFLNTFNAEDNAHMVAINEAIGFRRMEEWSEWGLEL
jgi:GNAT superfamily N-acetyltransferase